VIIIIIIMSEVDWMKHAPHVLSINYKYVARLRIEFCVCSQIVLVRQVIGFLCGLFDTYKIKNTHILTTERSAKTQDA